MHFAKENQSNFPATFSNQKSCTEEWVQKSNVAFYENFVIAIAVKYP